MDRTRKQAYLALLLSTAIWGISGPVIKNTLNYVPPLTFLFYRFLLSSLVIFPFFLRYIINNPLSFKDLSKLTSLAIMSTTINLSLLFLGFDKTTALDGTLISALTPIFIVIGGVWFFNEKVTSREMVGLTIAVAGTLVTVIQPILENTAFSRENLFGNLLILISGVEWAAFTLFTKGDLQKHSPFLQTSWASFIGLASFVPLAFYENPEFISRVQFNAIFNNYHVIFGIFYMAILSYLLAYFFYYYGLQAIEVSESALFAYLQPIFAAPLAVYWLKENLTIPFAIGALLVTIGVILTEIRSGESVVNPGVT